MGLLYPHARRERSAEGRHINTECHVVIGARSKLQGIVPYMSVIVLDGSY